MRIRWYYNVLNVSYCKYILTHMLYPSDSDPSIYPLPKRKKVGICPKVSKCLGVYKVLASCVFSAVLWSCQARNVNIKNWGGSPKLIFRHFLSHFSKSWLQMVTVPTWSYLYVVSPQRSKEFYEFITLHPQGSLAKDEDWCVGVPTIGTPGISQPETSNYVSPKLNETWNEIHHVSKDF